MRVVLGTWQLLGTASVDAEGKLVLPAPPRCPGLYRLRLLGSAPSVYIGETDDLVRRFSQYRNPGPSQRTNIRMNGRMTSHLAGGAGVSVEVCTDAFAAIGSLHEPLDLTRKSHRMLPEEEALAETRSGAMGTVENVCR
jgi:hypothetical protein